MLVVTALQQILQPKDGFQFVMYSFFFFNLDHSNEENIQKNKI